MAAAINIFLLMETIRESPLYAARGDVVECLLCERRCRIKPGRRGFCRTRENREGRLYTLAYGDISALESRPIEIKPFYHFYPGSTALTFSTWSCNFRCPWCQNWHLSRGEVKPEKANYVSPERIVAIALRSSDSGLCVSFQEPTLLFEYSLDAFKIARERRLYNCIVSNGYMTREALKMLHSAGMDAIKIDIKGDEEVYRKYLGGLDVSVVWRNAREAKKLGLHVEMVNLVVTGVNDTMEQIEALVEEHLRRVGPLTPLHFTRYHPAYKFSSPATNPETLEKAYRIAKRMGVHYPYVGNLPGHRYENTYCHRCGELLIERAGYRIRSYRITRDRKCPECGAAIPVVTS
jgi:pyruvate formate lyase activating enzyme